MAVKPGLLIQACVFIFVMEMNAHSVAQWDGPAIGDVLLRDVDDNLGFQEVQIYYSNGSVAPTWGGICGSTSDHNDANVICRQLGYTGGEAKQESISSPIPKVWLNTLECGDDPDYWHILRCGYTLASDQTSCAERLLVRCNIELITEHPFDGQVYLCPPDDPNLNSKQTSTSFGLIGIRLRNEWRGLNQPVGQKALRKNVGDAICRQLGYTASVSSSALTVNALRNSNITFKNCYNNDTKNRIPVQRKAWFTTEEVIRCQDSSTANCFGCCYTYPSSSSDDCSTCHINNDLVIGCTFDDTLSIKSPEGWPANKCNFNDGQLVSQDCNGSEGERSTVIGLAVSFTLSLLVIIGLIIAVVYKYM